MGVANISGNILTDSGASLSSYLPLTGGTLTGALTANGLVSANAKLEVNDANGIPIRFQDISAAITGQTAGYIGMSTSAFSGNNGDLVLYPRTSATSRILLMGGNVGIGTNAPDRLLQISNTAGQAVFSIIAADNDSADIFLGDNANKAEAVIRFVNGSNDLRFLNGGSERLRITSAGAIRIFDGTLTGTGGFEFTSEAFFGARFQSNAYKFMAGNNSTQLLQIDSLGCLIISGNGNGFTIGQASGVNRIDNTGSTFRCLGTSNGFTAIAASAFNVNSDYRLKEDLKDFNNSLDIVKSIKIYDFKWKDREERNYGVIAHELQEILPYIVYGEKDGMENNGEIKTQGVDYGKLVPVLVKAIQEQQEIINQLSAKVTALENK